MEVNVKSAIKCLMSFVAWVYLLSGEGFGSVGTQLHPNTSRGAGEGRTLDRQEWDSVNLFNGNLSLSIPLGINYPLAHSFGYEFKLHYNSNVWDFTPKSATVLSAMPEGKFNAGLGWDLSLGRLLHPLAPGNDSGKWVYLDPDGTPHPFYITLHHDVSEPENDEVFYTRDGNYLRLKQLSESTCVVEFPDGRVHTFEFNGDEWRLIKLSDRFTNHLSISYATPNAWTLTDSHGRTQQIFFRNDPSGFYPSLIDRVVLSAFGGTTATYTFAYTMAALSRPGTDNDPATPSSVNVPLLASVTAPDGTKHEFTYQTAGVQSDWAGRLSRMRLPTRGGIEWTYRNYAFSIPGCAQDFPAALRANVGVAARKLIDEAGATKGSWSYEPAVKQASDATKCALAGESSNTVTTPLGDKTVYYFSVNTKGWGPGWNPYDYALPIKKDVVDAGNYLSVEYFDCDAAGGNCSLTRSVYARYEQDSGSNPVDADAGNTNRREASSKTVYHDDTEDATPRFTAMERSNFDGLGHYRQEVTSGNFGSRDVRRTTINFDATPSYYPSAGYVTPNTADPWVLDIYNQKQIVEDGTSETTSYCFERATGFLKRQRDWRTTSPSGGPLASDRVLVFSRDAAGQLSKVQFYGGDVQAIGTGSLCSLSTGADQYQLRYTHQYGNFRSFQFYDAAGSPVGPKLVDQDIDRNTGLVSASRDSADLQTKFVHDALGRLTWEKPAAGHGAWKQITYTSANDTEGAKKFTFRLQNGGGAMLTYEAEVYDGFGRISWEQARMPDGTWPVRSNQYNAMGWVTSAYEFGADPGKYTSYLDYDPFGRARTVRPSDGAQHDVTVQYFGVRAVKRTVSQAVSYNKSSGAISTELRSTTKFYDRWGQLWKEVETYRDSFGSWRDRTYVHRYDPADHLLEKTLDGVRIGALRTYDGRGFLTSLSEDGETATFLDLDARGNSLHTRRQHHTTQTTYDLSQVFDRTGRLTAIRDSNNPGKVWKEFEYATANGTGDWRAGKLWRARRYNDMGTYLSSVGVAVVTETYAYGGVGGRVSRRNIEFSDQIGRSEKFSQGYSYDELGDVLEIAYPEDVAGSNVVVGRTRKVVNSYSWGRLIGIAGSFNSQGESWVNAINYHANGVTSQVAHANGVTDLIARDPDGLARVASVTTSGARNRINNAPDNFNSGEFFYDGTGRLVRAGSEYFLPVEGTVSPPELVAGQCEGACDGSREDPLGSTYATADNNGNFKVFYYYTADERLFRVEDGVTGERLWHFWNESGNPLTEHAMAHQHYVPLATTWQYTTDYIYRGPWLLSTIKLRRDAPKETLHYHIGHGSAGMTTDGQGFRVRGN
jgi:hypothetical protein